MHLLYLHLPSPFISPTSRDIRCTAVLRHSFVIVDWSFMSFSLCSTPPVYFQCHICTSICISCQCDVCAHIQFPSFHIHIQVCHLMYLHRPHLIPHSPTYPYSLLLHSFLFCTPHPSLLPPVYSPSLISILFTLTIPLTCLYLVPLVL